MILKIYISAASAFGNEFDLIIKEVNAANAGWVAGHNFHDTITLDDISKLCGALPNAIYDSQNSNRSRQKIDIVKGIPATFDSRTAWPDCTVIGQICDQGACGSCWAFGAAEMFSDRVCIATKGKINTMYSAEDLTSCCQGVTNGCIGGFPIGAMVFQPVDSMATPQHVNHIPLNHVNMTSQATVRCVLVMDLLQLVRPRVFQVGCLHGTYIQGRQGLWRRGILN